ncbi:MAG TPA: hypothetical protein VJL60_05255, partial [Gammaproteobacteria bacterium]|nr:hypothetical protein [Gammaproteobacteria bacterium]
KTPSTTPKQLLVDGILILSRETATSNRGVNLLKGLKLQYGNTTATPGLLYNTNNVSLPADYSGLVAAGGDLGTLLPSKQLINTVSMPMVEYDLNIFNDADEDSEVIARPSLTVEDGHAASYFSGTQLVLGITGSTAGTISSLDLGITMTITPHFQPGGDIDLDVEMGREFIIPQTNNTTFSQVLQTLKETTNTTINIRYGETAVLSTLYSTRVDKTQNITPFLSKLPLIKYFFSNKTSTTVQTNLITLLTPIKPITFDNKVIVPSRTQLIDYYKRYVGEKSHIGAILKNLEGLGIYGTKTPILPDLKNVKTLTEVEKLEFDSMYNRSPMPETPLPALPAPR